MEGPPFLRLPEEEGPKFGENSKQNDEESSNEMKPNEVKAIQILKNQPFVQLQQKNVQTSENQPKTLSWNT